MTEIKMEGEWETEVSNKTGEQLKNYLKGANYERK